MTDEEFLETIEDQGVDEALRLVIVEAWHKVQEELVKDLQ